MQQFHTIVAFSWMVACGVPREKEVSPEVIRLHVSASYSLPPGCAASEGPVKARLLTQDAAPCELDVSTELVAQGTCGGLTTNQPILRLQYYVGDAVLGEVVAKADLSGLRQEAISVDFSDSPLKTAASSMDSADTMNELNIDRAAGDTCTNMQEYCAGHLLTNTIDQCQ